MNDTKLTKNQLENIKRNFTAEPHKVFTDQALESWLSIFVQVIDELIEVKEN